MAGWGCSHADLGDTITGQLHVTLTEADFTAGSFALNPNGGLQSMTVTLRKQ